MRKLPALPGDEPPREVDKIAVLNFHIFVRVPVLEHSSHINRKFVRPAVLCFPREPDAASIGKLRKLLGFDNRGTDSCLFTRINILRPRSTDFTSHVNFSE